MARPRELHPAFFGCYDWHSAVHSHWTLVRLRRRFPELAEAAQIAAALDEHLTAANLAREAEYFDGAGRGTFERPYGWGWLLALAAELRAGRDAPSKRWAGAIRPLEHAVARRFAAWLPGLRQPIRTGTHYNTAFGMTLALDYARAAGESRLEGVIASGARALFGRDVAVPAAWEPGGDDFLSPALAEADLMRRIYAGRAFRAWWRRFLPGIPDALRKPAHPGRLDAKSIHLDGLNLSRAWALAGIAGALGRRVRIAADLRRLSAIHAAAGLARVESGDYLGEHWLPTFAVYLLTA